jgi:hypothetical protein
MKSAPCYPAASDSEPTLSDGRPLRNCGLPFRVALCAPFAFPVGALAAG